MELIDVTVTQVALVVMCEVGVGVEVAIWLRKKVKLLTFRQFFGLMGVIFGVAAVPPVLWAALIAPDLLSEPNFCF